MYILIELLQKVGTREGGGEDSDSRALYSRAKRDCQPHRGNSNSTVPLKTFCTRKEGFFFPYGWTFSVLLSGWRSFFCFCWGGRGGGSVNLHS